MDPCYTLFARRNAFVKDFKASKKSCLMNVQRRGLHSALKKRRKIMIMTIMFSVSGVMLSSPITSKSSIIAQKKYNNKPNMKTVIIAINKEAVFFSFTFRRRA